MKKIRKPKHISKADWEAVDSRKWTAKDFRGARPLREVFPDLAAWSEKRRRAKKGEPVKQAVSIRLSPDVIAHFKSFGRGWQTRIDEALRSFIRH